MTAKIPQDVTREDRLVGPLTLKQFLYVLGGGGISFILYRLYLLGYLYLIEFAPLAFIVVVFTLAMAFANINGRPFGTFLINLWTFLWSDKLALWNKDQVKNDLPIIKVDHKNDATIAQATQDKDKSQSNLEKLAHVLDAGGRMNEDDNASIRVGNIAESTTPSLDTSEAEDILNDVEE